MSAASETDLGDRGDYTHLVGSKLVSKFYAEIEADEEGRKGGEP